MASPLPLTIAIPTYRRERVLLDTIASLLNLDPPAGEILVLDQTAAHEAGTEQALGPWHASGRIRWLRLRVPSIPAAMNRGLLEASTETVLFVDDDIVPFPDLVAAHFGAHRESTGRLVAGRVLQPWDGDGADSAWRDKQFASTEAGTIDEFMGGNFSLPRGEALAIGGFDENFVRAAYRFEREFAERWRASGRAIRFEPRAAIRHLKASAGGTRTFGEHLTTILPAHSVGDYYYLLRSPLAPRRARAFLSRPFRSVMTRHHLRRPWWIPVTLVAEASGMVWALALHARGPRYCDARSPEGT